MPSLSRVAGLMGLGGLLVIVAGLAMLAADQRRKQYETTEAALRSTASFLADHANRLFEVADIALRGAANATDNLTWDGIAGSQALWRQLGQLKTTLPYVEDIWLNDQTGLLRLTTFAFPAPYSNAADRELFTVHREPGDRMHVGPLIVGRVTAKPTFLVSRRLENPGDHAFRGVVSVTASLAYFNDYWRRLDLPLDTRVSLARAEGFETLAQEPAPDPGQGFAEIEPAGFAVAIKADPVAGRYEGAERGSGAQRIGAYQRIGDLPLYVRIGVSRAAIERAWLQAMVPYGGFAGAALLALGLLTLMAFRQARRESEATHELERRVQERSRALAQHEEEMRLIVEGAADNVILTTDPAGRITTWSPGAEAILGWQAADAAGQPFHVIFTAEDRAAGIPDLELRTASTRGFASDQRWHERRDGTRVYLAGSVRPLRDASNRERGFLKIAHDETERRRAAEALENINAHLERRVAERTADLAAANTRLEREIRDRESAEQQLQQSQKMEAVGQLTGGLAHDFNNMLAVVISGLTLLRKRLSRDGERPDLGQFVEAAMDGATRAAHLTARLLAFSRRQPLAPELVDVNGLVAGMSELLRRTLGEHIRMEVVLGDAAARIFADPAQLENAILNLAVNARDAMPEGGSLRIETGPRERDPGTDQPRAGVLIAVTDTGAGMPADVVAKAFDPFFTTKPPGKGSGLGLSMVYNFARQSGGSVEIESEPGRGTCVRIVLPRASEEAVATARPRLDEPGSELPRGRPEEIVLVVDDEQRVRDMSVASLRELGYTVLHAGSAAEALEVLRTHPGVSLLFTDMVMPDIGGAKLAERAREMRPGLRTLFTTGFSSDLSETRDADVLLKPYTLEQLAVRIREVVGT